MPPPTPCIDFFADFGQFWLIGGPHLYRVFGYVGWFWLILANFCLLLPLFGQVGGVILGQGLIFEDFAKVKEPLLTTQVSPARPWVKILIKNSRYIPVQGGQFGLIFHGWFCFTFQPHNYCTLGLTLWRMKRQTYQAWCHRLKGVDKKQERILSAGPMVYSTVTPPPPQYTCPPPNPCRFFLPPFFYREPPSIPPPRHRRPPPTPCTEYFF